MKAKIFALAAALIAVTASAASALPKIAPGLHNEVITSQVVHRERDGNDNFHMRNRHNRHWNRGYSNGYNYNRGYSNRYNYSSNYDGRYEQYRGWHRYSHRPSRWSNRGCVAAGPIWFCP